MCFLLDKMIYILFSLVVFSVCGEKVDYNQYDYDVSTKSLSQIRITELDPAPIPLSKEQEKISISHSFDCDNFAAYAAKCESEARALYTHRKETPPLPENLQNWCRALRYMASCATDWNTYCKGEASSSFDVESIQGHRHVLTHLCEDEIYQTRYENITKCVESATYDWEVCYVTFKAQIAEHMNASVPSTHYEAHFYLCCARAQFRRCTLGAAIKHCDRLQALVLQRFSVVSSQGDVNQDCDRNMIYDNCPGGDPRPPAALLAKLTAQSNTGSRSEHTDPLQLLTILSVTLTSYVAFLI